MAAPHSASAARIRVSATLGGTYTTVAYVRSGDFDRGSEGETVQKWLGGSKTVSGDRTLSLDVPVWWDNDDTTGQTLMETAWASGGTLGIQVCPRGTAPAAKVYQFEGRIGGAPISFDSEGVSVEGTFTATGDITTYSVITLA
jgi:hypothetical protein